MKLMVAEMRYQDPSKPMGMVCSSSPRQRTVTNIELLQKVQEAQTDMLAFQSVSILSSGLVGKTVTGTAIDGSTVTGKVDAAQVVAKNGVVTVGGKQIPVVNVTEVR